ncbi:GGDEF domain-containing protein [Ideonella sp. 4Y16]|uniref:GGDEF domain-containing protein n=1 Tax=Ideonella alba TaxID=2824118 RepID=UPI001B390312|nr:GGDEF domain-containing protein [Ideonella alba]MBQ0944559.1 GGDEF domain-containing protein [Ideonella alba]
MNDASTAPPPPLPTDARTQLAQHLARAGSLRSRFPAEALALCEQAEVLARALDSQGDLARALLRAGQCLSALAVAPAGGTRQQHQQAAHERLGQAMELFVGLEDRHGEAEAANTLANLHAACGAHAQALPLYHRSLSVRRDLGDRIGEAGVLNNIGLLLRDTAQFADALACLFASLELAEDLGDERATAHALASIGTVLAELGETGRATEFHLRALAVLEQWPDPALEASARTGLGRLLARTGHPEEALSHLERALAVAHRSGRIDDLASALHALGQAHQGLAQPQRAEWLLHEALAAARRGGQPLAEAEVLLSLGELRGRQGDSSDARPLLLQALSGAERLQADHLAGRVHRALSRWHEQQREFEAALRHHQAFHDCLQRVQGQAVQRRLRTLLAGSELKVVHRDAEHQRRRGDALAEALDIARASDRHKDELVRALRHQAELLRQLAREDGLTGVANRRWLDSMLMRERERARRHGHPLAVAMIDLDHFKAINDRCSHHVGDEVLRRIGRLLLQTCRQGDLVGRYGGEEFLVVLVETPLAAARGVCEKLRRLVATMDVEGLHPTLSRVTVSIGVAGDAADPVAEDLVQAADRELYRAKREGRNRVCG